MEFKKTNECAAGNHHTGLCTDKKIFFLIRKLMRVEDENINKLLKNGEYNFLKEAYGKIKEEKIKKIIENQMLYRFKPYGPTGSEWLSNFDIENVLTRYSQFNPKFTHFPFHMIDFYETKEEIAVRDFSKDKKEKRCMGLVMNTDDSRGMGIHWFALFIDFRENGTVEYFNSSGLPPLEPVNRWMIEMSTNYKCKRVIASPFRYQNDNHSCGVYSLYYILSRAEGYSYQKFRNRKINDELMGNFRQFLFRDHNTS